MRRTADAKVGTRSKAELEHIAAARDKKNSRLIDASARTHMPAVNASVLISYSSSRPAQRRSGDCLHDSGPVLTATRPRPNYIRTIPAGQIAHHAGLNYVTQILTLTGTALREGWRVRTDRAAH